ncbi:hypothetical protein [Nocardiopsis tropica]|uniref:Uncharacterized protein n=1 Tax=Nocardiopsis tropica TaxID=109330 RepID=A0ABU7L248_9ACTN|nr:hypothetical protein [Nocardiopsis umidischolae]MEE2055624.1 hypothetical protein [Nocardiopsis umidischolae]
MPRDEPGWADPAEEYAARGFASSLETQLRAGISEFCGIAGAAAHPVHGGLDPPEPTGADAAVDATAYPGAMSTNRL